MLLLAVELRPPGIGRLVWICRVTSYPFICLACVKPAVLGRDWVL
jgi:hypothetical protein